MSIDGKHMKTPPIEPLQLPGTVVNIGDIRVARGLTRRPQSTCKHRHMAYDPQERRIYCYHCEQEIEPFDAFVALSEQWKNAFEALESRREELRELREFEPRRRATKEMDRAWRSRNMVPACPHCHHGLFPEDFERGVTMIGREYAQARLKKRSEVEKGNGD